MPTEFFHEENGFDYYLAWSTYQVLKGHFQPKSLISYLIEGRPELKVVEEGVPAQFGALLERPHYEGSIESRLIETPDGLARLIGTYHNMPEFPRDFMQFITIGSANSMVNPAALGGHEHPVLAARYVHLLMHNVLLVINDDERVEYFVEDDTPKHIERGIVDGMIRLYQEDMADYPRRRNARMN